MACCGSLMLGVVLLAAATTSSAEVVSFTKCHLGAKKTPSCTISEVRITPCPEALQNQPCVIKPSSNITFSFDFTPAFSATKMGTAVYKVDSFVDVPFDGLDTDGCKHTTCPLVAGKLHQFSYQYTIDKLPSGTTKGKRSAKIKLWNEDDYHQQCCFKTGFTLGE